MEGGPPGFRPRFTAAVLLRKLDRQVSALSPTGRLPSVVRGSTRLRLGPDLVTAAGSDTIQTRVLRPPACNACPLTHARFRLFPFRSPLLGESRLISFPRGTEMFQFPRLPSRAYEFSSERRRIAGVGLPHSEIRGSMPVQRLTAAYRSRPRPSSAPGAKASTVCPYYLDGELRGRRSAHGVEYPFTLAIGAVFKLRRVLTTGSSRRRSLKTEQRTPGAQALPTRPAVPGRIGTEVRSTSRKCLPRKEVIQPQLPLRLPCYDFTPITSPTFDGSLPEG